MAKADTGLTVDTGQLAALFKCDDRTVRFLAERGIVRRVGRGRYDFQASVQGYIVHLREQAAKHSADGNLNAVNESALLNRERRRNIKREGEVAAGNLIPASYVEEVMADHIKGVRGMVLGWPNEAALELPHLTNDDIGELRRIAEKTLRDNALTHMAQTGQHPEIEQYIAEKQGKRMI